MRLKDLLPLFLLFLGSQNISGQILKSSQSLELQFFGGRLFKHTPKIQIPIREASFGFLVSWQKQTDGSQAWHIRHRLPRIGVSLQFYDLGEKSLLGESWGIWPHIGIPLWRKEKLDLSLAFGSGLAYINRTFHPVDNPENQLIGSNWSFLANFRFDLCWKVYPQVSFLSGFHLNHYSNGAYRLPNLGANFLSLQLGIRYTPSPVPIDENIYADRTDKLTEKRWGINSHFAMGLRQTITGGPRYPIYIASLAATYRLNLAHKLLAGLDYEYNRGVFAFGQHTESFSSNKQGTWLSSRLMFFIADEVMFGNWGILFQLGTYLNSNALLLPGSIYFKLGSRYYLPPIKKYNSRFYAAFYLKSHGAIAEYTSLGIGIEL